MLNDLSHSASISGEVKGLDKIDVQFMTKSTHKPFHGFVVSLKHELSNSKAATEVKAFNEEKTFFVVDVDLMKNLEKGYLTLETPYPILKTFKISSKTRMRMSKVGFLCSGPR